MEGIVINYWAVLVAALSSMVIGSLWYGPVFGKAWMKLAGLTRESLKTTSMSPMRAMSVAVVSSFAMAYVLAHVADAWLVVDASSAFTLAFWIWLGFVATTQLAGVLWEGKPWRLWVLNAVCSLVTLYVMTLILTYWR